MQLFFPQIITLMAGLVLAQVNVQQKNSTSLPTSSLTPLFQPVSQTFTTEAGTSGTSLISNPTGTTLFHVVSPSATLIAKPTTTSAAATSDAVTPGSKKSAAGHCHGSLTAAVVVLGMVMSLVAVMRHTVGRCNGQILGSSKMDERWVDWEISWVCFMSSLLYVL